MSYVPAPYVGGVTSYRDSEMATKYKYDKPVFNSRDFTKRDEFSNDIRTKQWRILLEKELAVTSKALESTMAKAGLSIASPVRTTIVAQPLYVTLTLTLTSPHQSSFLSTTLLTRAAKGHGRQQQHA